MLLMFLIFNFFLDDFFKNLYKIIHFINIQFIIIFNAIEIDKRSEIHKIKKKNEKTLN